MLVTILQCVPVDFLWYAVYDGYCWVEGDQLYVGSSVPHVINRRNAAGLSGATDLETTHAQVTQNHVDYRICSGQHVRCCLLCVTSIITLPEMELKTGPLTDE